MALPPKMHSVSQLTDLLNCGVVQSLQSSHLTQHDIRLDIKRDDLIHPIISGNKWLKLKHLLFKLESQGIKKLAVMGGAYSNLLHSLSYICFVLGWELTLYVRGYPKQKLTPMLQDAVTWGATICYQDRLSFRALRDNSPTLADDVYWINEGGYNLLALQGCADSLAELKNCDTSIERADLERQANIQIKPYDYIIIASATGTSLAGYCLGIAQLKLKTKAMGIAVLKNDDEIETHVKALVPDLPQPTVIKGFEFGGYAKKNAELESFIENFEQQHQIPLEPIYTGKSFYATFKLIEQGYFAKGSRLLLIHSGGLQGKR
jgi:1-aminocyclopropane-1-carboxylate deaminase